MKRYALYTLLLAGMLGSSCSDTWNNHYGESETIINNDNILIVNESLTDYLSQESSLSATYQLFSETGVLDELLNRDQLFTVIAVDGSITTKQSKSSDDLYTAQTYISDVSLSPSNITDGQRILMWSGKYLNVGLTTSATGANIISFNDVVVSKIIKLNDGYLYVVNQEISAPRSMYEIIENLGDEYSTFRDMIISRNVNVFDQAASTPVGVDNQGRTVYDSVFTVKASYFAQDGFDLMSENTQATMFIPSNDVIEEALSTARASLDEWGLERADSVLQNWFIKSTFFDEVYERSALEDPDNIDLKSIFDQQWRTTVQELDLDNPITMSNGIAYYVTKMKIPTNVLIYRLKDYFKYYETMTAEEKETYFQPTNLTYQEVKKVAGHSGWPAAGFPANDYNHLIYKLTDSTNKTYTLDFTPFMYEETSSTTHTTRAYKVPAGTYTLHMGFAQEKKGKLGNINIYVNGELIGTATTSQHSGTTFHYDRNGGGYPEGYDASAATKAGVSKSSNYGRDGGQIGTVTFTGDAAPIVIRFEASGSSLSNAYLYHWCLKPTSDCY